MGIRFLQRESAKIPEDAEKAKVRVMSDSMVRRIAPYFTSWRIVFHHEAEEEREEEEMNRSAHGDTANGGAACAAGSGSNGAKYRTLPQSSRYAQDALLDEAVICLG